MFVIQCETKTFFTKKKKILYIGSMHNVKRVEDALKFNAERHANNFRRTHNLDRNIWKVRRI